MIILTDKTYINQGSLRACYQHPENPNLIIKIPVGEKKEKNRANLKEQKGYHALIREHVDLFCISHCYGFVTTNLGIGLVCDCIRDHNGNISKTIWDIIGSGKEYDTHYILEVANSFCNMLISRNIFLFDLNVKNIVLQLRDDGTYQPFAIDLKGRYDNNEFLPFSTYIKFFAQKKIERRSKQLIERISLFGTNSN